MTAAFGWRVHAPRPLQEPPQPAKRYPLAGVARRLNSLPDASVTAHVFGHLMPSPVTRPLPLTVTETLTLCAAGFAGAVVEVGATVVVVVVAIDPVASEIVEPVEGVSLP